MPTGTRIRTNNVYGVLSDNPLAIGATTMNSTGLSVLPVVASAHAIIVLDPKRVFGEPEIVVVTSHTSGNTSAIITRGQYGTSARAHALNTPWAHIAIDEDFTEIVTSITRPANPYMGQMIFETDTIGYKFWNGTTWTAISTGSGSGGSGGGGTLGYAQVTADQTGISSFVPLTGLSVTITIPAGRRIKITGHAQIGNDGTAGVLLGQIMEGATEVGRWVTEDIAANSYVVGDGSTILTPTAGTHTYFLNLRKFSGIGTIYVDAQAEFPAWILVEDISSSETPFSNPNVPVGMLGQTSGGSGVTTASVTDVDLGVSLNVNVPAGRVLKVTARARAGGGAAGDVIKFKIKMDGTEFANSSFWVDGNWGTTLIPLVGTISPTSGAHIFTVTFHRETGSGTTTSQGVDILLVEDITPTPATGTGAPGSTLGYAQRTTGNIVIGTTITDIPELAVTVTVPEGRRLKITAHGGIQNTQASSNQAGWIVIREGAQQLQVSSPAQFQVTGTYGDAAWLDCTYVTTPTAGNHTYKVSCVFNNTAGVFIGQATAPAFLLVEDITGAMWPDGVPVTPSMIANEVWTDFVPTLLQGATTITKTVNYARYMRFGRMVTSQVGLTITGAGPGAQDVIIGLPVPCLAAALGIHVGTGAIYNSSNFATYPGIAELSSTTSIRLRCTGAAGIRILGSTDFAEAFASGDGVVYSVIYEAAS